MTDRREMVEVIVQMGGMLLSSGAEIYRVEETTVRMGKTAGFSKVEVYATPTGLFVTLIDQDQQTYTLVRRIHRVDNDLDKIAQINALSRNFTKGMSLADVQKEIARIQNTPPAGGWQLLPAGAVGSAAFAVIFGGTYLEAIMAGLIGFFILLVITLVGDRAPRFLTSALGSGLAALIGIVGEHLWGVHADTAILSGVMVLVPGVTMTTAIRDMLTGELVSGVARSAEALTIAMAVAAGVAVVLGIWGV